MRLRYWVGATLTAIAACTPLTVDDTLPPDASVASDASTDSAVSSDSTADAWIGFDSMSDTATTSDVATDRSMLPDVVSTDAADADVADVADTGIMGPCYGLDAGFSVLWVNAQAPVGGTGVPGCPLRTITSALAIAPPGTSIFVAAGTYDATLGEVFPLVVRGVTISGADSATTIVRGRGSCPQLIRQIGACDVAMIVGDTNVLTSISNLTFAYPGAASGDYYAMLCDRGNAPAAPGAHELPNTTLFGLNIHSDFTGGIVATTAVNPLVSACNLSVTGSSMQGGHFGVWGLGDVDHHVRPAIEVGDGTLQGVVSFSGQHDGVSGSGAGVRIWDEVGRLIVRGSTFQSSDQGIDIAQHSDFSPWQNHFEITGNEFLSLSNNGVAVGYASVVDLLSGNTFTGISSGSGGSRATALALDSWTNAATFYPAVRVARSNSFVGNDVAIELRGSTTLDTQSTQSDFGTAGDPGGNIFRCNAGTLSTIGADVLIRVAASGGAITIPFVGNAWDHAPPTTSSTVNGNDISRTATGAPNVDASNATVATATCPAGRTP